MDKETEEYVPSVKTMTHLIKQLPGKYRGLVNKAEQKVYDLQGKLEERAEELSKADKKSEAMRKEIASLKSATEVERKKILAFDEKRASLLNILYRKGVTPELLKLYDECRKFADDNSQASADD